MKFRHFAVALALLAIPAMSSAGLITVSTTGTVENFSSRSGIGYGFTAGPVTLPSGVVFTAGTAGTNSGIGGVLGTGDYGLGSNGWWNTYFAGVDGPTNWMIFEFPTAVSAISAFMNYYPGLGGNPTIEALDASFAVLEGYDLSLLAPISTPGGSNAGAWRGIVRGTSDIKAFRVTNGYAVVDDLTFGGVPSRVPEPGSSLLLLGMGLAGLGRAWNKRRG